MKFFLWVLIILMPAQSLWAQSFFYNSHQFGMNSTLLGGAVTAGNDDLSMAYYNPAALHLAKPRANISLVQPRVERFGFGNFFGEEANNTNLDVDFSPNIASYKLTINDHIKLIALTIQRSFWDQDVNSKSIVEDGNGRTENIFEYSYRGRDRWLGAGVNYQINERFSMGWSQFISFARSSYSYTLSRSTFDLPTAERTTLFSNRLSTSLSNSLSLVTKLGLHWQLGNQSLGFVVTTPNYLPVFRSGSFEKVQIDISGEEAHIDELVNFDLNPDIKTPWEFNVGYSVAFDNESKLWFNGSFYPKISDYTVSKLKWIDGRQTDWVNGNRQISNFALGYSNAVSDRIELVGSVRTNFFAYENKPIENDKERLFILDDDRLHLVLGANFDIRGNEVLMGVDWGFSRAENTELFKGFPSIEQFNTTESSFFNGSLTLLLTYGFIFDRQD